MTPMKREANFTRDYFNSTTIRSIRYIILIALVEGSDNGIERVSLEAYI